MMETAEDPLTNTAPSTEREVALRLRGVDKRFGPTHAVADVSLEVGSAEIRVLVGGNGSGKSTLVKIMAGIERADSGSLEVAGETHRLDEFSPALARKNDMHFVHQQSSTFQDLTVAENLFIGRGFVTSGRGRVRWRATVRRAAEVLRRFEIAAGPEDSLGELRPATQTMIAVARALQDQDETRRGILVLDEPTAPLPPDDVEILFAALRGYARLGQTILLITHRLDEALSIADAITVMRDGRHVATVEGTRVSHDDLIELIVGRPVKRHVLSTAGDRAGARKVLDCQGIAGRKIRGIDFSVGHGEIVGLAGQGGSGRSSLLRMLFGAEPMTGGSVSLEGKRYAPGKPADAMKAGVAHVPEDRPVQAVFGELSVAENLTMSTVDALWRAWRLRRGLERSETERDIERFRIRTRAWDAPIDSLSGGNQQKVILARWMRRSPRLLLLDEPTQGVDVGARAEIWSLVEAAIAADAAALVVLSDFDELLTVCHRVLVLRDGALLADVPAGGLSIDDLNGLLHAEAR